MAKAYEIDSAQDQIVIRIDGRLVDRAALTRVLDFIELESLRQRSRLASTQAEELAREVDRAVWDQVKHKYEEE